jgi:hypothetical protein
MKEGKVSSSKERDHNKYKEEMFPSETLIVKEAGENFINSLNNKLK